MQDSQYEMLDAALNVMVKGPRHSSGPSTAAPGLAGLDARDGRGACSHTSVKRPADDPVRNRLRTSLVVMGLCGRAGRVDGRHVAEHRGTRRDLIYERLAARPQLIAEI